MGLWENTVKEAEARYAKVNRAYDDFSTGKENVGELALTGAGQAGGMLGDIMGLPVEYAASGLYSLVPNAAQQYLEGSLQNAVSSQPVQSALQLAQQYPRTTENIGNALNIASALPVVGSAIKGTNKALRGSSVAGVPNYIDNYYGTGAKEIEAIPPTKFELRLGSEYLKRRGGKGKDWTPSNPNRIQEAVGAARSIKGLANAATTGAASFLNSLTPSAKALYNETGVSKQTQKRIASLLTDPTKRNLEKAMAQAIYNSHILVQAKRKGNVSKALEDIRQYSFVTDYSPVSLKEFAKGGRKTPSTGVTSKADLEFAYKQMVRTQTPFVNGENNAALVFKVPSGTQSGDHFRDFAFKSPYKTPIAKARKTLEDTRTKVSNKNLFEALSNSPDLGTRFKLLTPTLESVEKNGIWVQSGTFVGSAVVEGGITGIAKVFPDGSMQNYMFDTHDFLEKAPLVGDLINKTLPTKMIAVSGPIYTNFKGVRKGARTKEQLEDFKDSKGRSPVTAQETGGTEEAIRLLTALAAEKPSSRGVLNETIGLLSPTGKESIREFKESYFEEEET